MEEVWGRLSLRFKIMLLVTLVVGTGTVVFGRFAYAGLGEVLSEAAGLGARTAAETIADSIDPTLLKDFDVNGDLNTPVYQELDRRMRLSLARGSLARVSIIRLDWEAGRATYLMSLPEDESSAYLAPGESDSIMGSTLYQVEKSDYSFILLDQPGFFMLGRAPIMVDGKQMGLVFVATDVTEIKTTLGTITLGIAAVILVILLLTGMVSYKFASNFEKTAVTDGLMGIYNHKYFKQRLEEEVAKARRYGQPTSLVLFDIDFFKRVNDTYGHATGDLVLKLMAKWVTGMCRTSDVICRYGGEEIACILPHTGIAGAQEFAERLRIKISEQVVHDPEEDVSFRVTVSVGVAQWEKGMEMTDLIRATDAALYHSKRTGRNRVTIYHEELLPAPDMASKPERTKDRPS